MLSFWNHWNYRNLSRQSIKIVTAITPARQLSTYNAVLRQCHLAVARVISSMRQRHLAAAWIIISHSAGRPRTVMPTGYRGVNCRTYAVPRKQATRASHSEFSADSGLVSARSFHAAPPSEYSGSELQAQGYPRRRAIPAVALVRVCARVGKHWPVREYSRAAIFRVLYGDREKETESEKESESKNE